MGTRMFLQEKATGRLAAIGLAVAITAGAHVTRAAQTGSGSWRLARVFSASSGVVQLDGVDAVSSTDAWLTGDVFPAQPGQAPILVEHWDGGTWRQIPVPASLDPHGLTIAGDVAGASSAANAWVFGNYQGTAGPFEVALGWNGTTWHKFTFPLGSSVNATAVFGPSDAWGFGENQMTGQPLVVRFNGRAWQKVTVPVVPQGASSVSPSRIWIVGARPAKPGTSPTFALARWDGSAWHATDLPKLSLPKGTSLFTADVLALSSRDIWVTGSLASGQGVAPGWVLLHLTASGWHRIKVPFPPGTLSGISSDGQRGIWLTAPGVTSAKEYFLHYAGGQWTRQLAPSTQADVTEMNSISWAPGASSGWSGGSVISSDGTSQGALLTFSP